MVSNKENGFSPILIILTIAIIGLGAFALFPKPRNPNVDIFSQVESLFESYKANYNIQTVKTNDSNVVWTTSEGFSIGNQESPGVELKLDCGRNVPIKTGDEMRKSLLSDVAPKIDSLLIENGYSVSGANTSSTFEERRYYQGYEKETVKCLFEAADVCGGRTAEDLHFSFSFMCTENLEHNVQQQLVYLKDLELMGGKFIKIHKKTSNLVYLMASGKYGFGGAHIIAELQNGKWTQVTGGQDVPSCSTVEKYQIPKDFFDTCYDRVNKELLPNNN